MMKRDRSLNNDQTKFSFTRFDQRMNDIILQIQNKNNLIHR
jgi:hypothetical protein